MARNECDCTMVFEADNSVRFDCKRAKLLANHLRLSDGSVFAAVEVYHLARRLLDDPVACKDLNTQIIDISGLTTHPKNLTLEFVPDQVRLSQRLQLPPKQ